MSDFMTVVEAAAFPFIGERAASGWVRSGRIPAIEVGAPWRVAWGGLDAWAAAGGEPEDGWGEHE